MVRILSCAALTLAMAQPALAEAPAVDSAKISSPALRNIPNSFADLVEKLSPAVVNISTTQTIKSGGGVQMFGVPEGFPNDPAFDQFREFFEQFNRMQGGGMPADREVTSLGSGFVIDTSGYIITNYHVIADAEEITVRFSDDTKLKAKIVGRDQKTDLALLKVESKKPLAFVPLGDSDKARVGDWVIAIGNPFGLGGTVTAGIVSARQRSINAGPYDDFIQTDASINRGNSGGPLFNTDGEVIGINSAIFSTNGGSIGIGFSIPSNLAKPIIEQLKQFGKTHRGWLGVKIQDVTDEIANSVGLKKGAGALVVEITEGSPAEKAGVQVGDVITHFNDKEITEMRFLPRMVAESKIGEKASVTVWRKGESKKLSLTVLELKDDEERAQAAGEDGKPRDSSKGVETALGLSVATLDDAVRADLNLPKTLRGVVIADVDAKSEAAKRGLKRGDVIVEINNEKIDGASTFKRLVGDAKKAGRNFALLQVLRGKNTTVFLTLPLD
jgi:serine protease Do